MADLDTFVQYVRDLIIETADDSMPLERGLAAHRHSQARKIKKMAGMATSVRDLAYEAADNLAKEKIVLAELLEAAKNRRKQFGTRAEAEADKEYARLCDEISESKTNIAEMEEEAAESFKDSDEAIRLINDQSDNLARVARADSRMIRREKMVSLREQQQVMREQILNVFPEDRSDYRQRQSDKLDKRERKLKARKDVVDAMWQHQNPAGKAEEVGVGAKSVMDDIESSL